MHAFPSQIKKKNYSGVEYIAGSFYSGLCTVYKPHRGSFFSIFEITPLYGAVRCGAVRCSSHFFKIMRCGAVRITFVNNRMVRCGAVRCGYPLTSYFLRFG